MDSYLNFPNTTLKNTPYHLYLGSEVWQAGKKANAVRRFIAATSPTSDSNPNVQVPYSNTRNSVSKSTIIIFQKIKEDNNSLIDYSRVNEARVRTFDTNTIRNQFQSIYRLPTLTTTAISNAN